MLAVTGFVLMNDSDDSDAAGTVNVDFCLSNGALEDSVHFVGNSGKYFVRHTIASGGTLDSMESLYRTDGLELEFDGWYTEIDGGEKITMSTVFSEYTILYDHWKSTTLTPEQIISEISIDNKMLEAGKTAGTYESATITDERFALESVEVYSGLNAFRTNKLASDAVLEEDTNYSVKVTLFVKAGYHLDRLEGADISCTNGLASEWRYNGHSGTNTQIWDSDVNRAFVIINFPFELNYFTGSPSDAVIENGNAFNGTFTCSQGVTSSKLYVKTAGDTWSTLDSISGAFSIPAQDNQVKTYRIGATLTTGFTIFSDPFTVDWYDPDAPRFLTQPMDGYASFGQAYHTAWSLNFDPSATLKIELFNAGAWTEYQVAQNDNANITAMHESGTYTFRVHAVKDAANYYSEEFHVTWGEKFEFTTQPIGIEQAVDETYTVTWASNVQPDQMFKIESSYDGISWNHNTNLDYAATTYNFGGWPAAGVQHFRLMANYQGVIYYSDVFTRTVIAGEFTLLPPSDNSAVTGQTCHIEWDFNLDVNQYEVYVYEGDDFDLMGTTVLPEYDFVQNTATTKQYLVKAVRNSVELYTVPLCLFNITWTDPIIQYLVQYDANGGAGSMASAIVEAGNQYTLLANGFTAPAGKEFKCWSVSGVEKNPGDKITVDAPVTVSAVWKDLTFTVSFDANGGTGSMADVTGVSGQYALPDNGFTAPSGKQFKCWSVNDQEKNAGDSITVTADVTVKAVWKDIVVPEPPYEEKEVDGKKVYEVETAAGVVTPVTDLFNAAKTGGGSVDIKAGDVAIFFDSDAVSAIAGNAVTLKAELKTSDTGV